MKYLLDTHIVLWFAENSPKLSDEAISIILSEHNEKYVNIASCLEVSIKLSLGKLDLVGGTSEFFRIIHKNGFGLLQVNKEHLIVLESLPFHHRDPFDRILVATAISDNLSLLTNDSQLLTYAGEGLQLAP